MQRAIVTPAVMAGAALDELKSWLAITTSRDDAYLTKLLHAALDMCEAFTGQMVLAATCEEVLSPAVQWQRLRTRPVQAVLEVAARAANGARIALPVADYAIDLDADGGARIRLQASDRITPLPRPLVVTFTAGLAADWEALPDSLRQGVVRLAADQFAQRDGQVVRLAPPSVVAALWQPWRRMRLA